MVNEVDFRKAYNKWAALDFDVVFLALNMPEGADFIRKFRKFDSGTTILSGDGLDVGGFIEELKEIAENVVIATIYNSNSDFPALKTFKKKYWEKYNEDPDVWAIQGYDSLQLIVQAIEQTDSCSPAVLADYLRNMKVMKLTTGNITFNEYGEIQGREVFKKKVVDGKFKYID
jgi:branched-chain amino acid transport system substrate-binding protein